MHKRADCCMSTCLQTSETESIAYTYSAIAKHQIRPVRRARSSCCLGLLVASRFPVRRGPLHFLPPLHTVAAAELLWSPCPCFAPSDAGYLNGLTLLHISSVTNSPSSVAVDMDGSHDPFFRRQSSKVCVSQYEAFFSCSHVPRSLDDTYG